MTLTEHVDWPLLKLSIKIQLYARDGGHHHPRHRLEVSESGSSETGQRLLAITTPCCACGRIIHPVRQRRGHMSRLYLAVACELEHSFACARGSKARQAYIDIAEAVRNQGAR